MSNLKEHSSPLVNKILREVPLSVRFMVDLQMEDIENWKDGEYLGDRGNKEEVNNLIEIVKKWIKDGNLDNF